MGWSEDWETGHDGATIAAHLRLLLRQAGEKEPFVLIGHSLGGSLVQGYTALYSRDVLALGFVDPSHPDQLERFGPEIEQQQRDFWAMIGHASRLARVGVLRATNMLGRLARGLPERDYRTARMFAASPRHLRTSHAEMIAWDATMAAARRASTFGNRPTVVISATMAMEGMSDDMLGTNHEMHAEIAALSTRGEHVKLPGTDHYSLLMNREHARETAAVLRGLIEQARSAQPASR